MEANLLSIAQQFSGLPMDALIGGPLNAAADANAKMAVTQTKFLLDTCFTKQSGGNYKPIMIVMELSRPVIDSTTENVKSGKRIQEATVQFNLPLLTIVPLNSLAVDSVNVTFDMEVKSSFTEEASKTEAEKMAGEASVEAKLGWGPFSVTVKGSASYDSSKSTSESQHYEKSNSARYHVDVHAGQLPLPMGVTTIINAFANSIQPIMITEGSKPEDNTH